MKTDTGEIVADEDGYHVRVLSMGGGRQTDCAFRMNVLGELGPLYDLVVFGDTQNEAAWTYEALDVLDREYGHILPIVRASAGNLAEDWFDGQNSIMREENAMGAAMPFHLKMDGGDAAKGFAMRTCSDRMKVRVVRREVRKWLGLKPGERVDGRYKCQMSMGIAVEEAHRMSDSPLDWIDHYYPFIELKRMRTYDCARWMESKGFTPVKQSACVQCPFRSDDAWRELREHSPADWKYAVEFDKRIRAEAKYVSSASDPSKSELRGEPFLHASLKPLDEVDLNSGLAQIEMFGNDCTGHCGV